MERLTVNKPVEEMNMTELAHNSCYAKDRLARYRDFDTDIDARDFARKLMVEFGIWKSYEKYGLDADNELVDDDIFDDTMFDNLQFVDCENMTTENLITLFYRNIWAMADLHTRLKTYEDAEEQGLIPRLPCKAGDLVDKLFSHNETVALWYEEDSHIKKCFWRGMAWNIPEQYKNCEFVKIFGTIPMQITEADTINIIVKIEAEQALARMEGGNG